MIKRIALLVLLSSITFSLFSQKHSEFSIGGSIGGSWFNYSRAVDGITDKSGFTKGFGAGYHYFFSEKWAVGTGVYMAWYNGGVSSTNYSESSDEIRYSPATPGGEPFTFTYKFNEYDESLSVTMITIPVMLQYQARGRKAFYLAGGMKVGIPIEASYKPEGTFTTTGYSASSVTITGDGFGTFERTGKYEVDAQLAFMLAFETGIKWTIGSSWKLYTGVYFDYGLNNINKNLLPQAPLVAYQSATPAEFVYGSITESSKWSPAAFGITVRLSFTPGLNQSYKKGHKPTRNLYGESKCNCLS